MKRNPKDQYYLVEGDSKHIVDADTGEKQLFLIDRQNNLVFRSMLEEDIKSVVAKFNLLSSSEKRKAKESLMEALPKKGSQKYFFVMEEIQPIDYFEDDFRSEEPDWIYGYPRKIIGFGARVQKEESIVTRKCEEYIDTTVFRNYEDRIQNLIKLIEEAGKCYGIEGRSWILPAAKAK